MEFAEFKDLLQRIKIRKNNKHYFSELFINKLIVCLVEGLYSLHYKNILYRDMKVSLN